MPFPSLTLFFPREGDRADWIDQTLLDMEIQPVIPSKANEEPTKIATHARSSSIVKPIANGTSLNA